MSKPDKTRLGDLQRKFLELEKLGDKPGPSIAQTRGRDFENLLLELCNVHELLIRASYHTVDNSSEQIDGAIRIGGRIALIEAKWAASDSLAASELFSFLGKVEGKFVGTIGVFISRNELSSNFLNALRAGRRQSIVVVHGQDVPAIFDSDFALQHYLESALEHVSIDNEPHLSVAHYKKRVRLTVEAATAEKRVDDAALLADLSKPNAPRLFPAIIKHKNVPTLIDETFVLLQSYPLILLNNPTSSLQDAIPSYIAAAIQRFPNADTEPDRKFFGDLLEVAAAEPYYAKIIEAFAPRLAVVSPGLASSAGAAMRAAWLSAAGNYDRENKLVPATEVLWKWLPDDFRKFTLRLFIGFLNSSRKPSFPQYRLARDQLANPDNSVLRDQALREALTDEIASLRAIQYDDTLARSAIDHSFKNIRQLLGSDFDTIADAVLPGAT